MQSSDLREGFSYVAFWLMCELRFRFRFQSDLVLAMVCLSACFLLFFFALSG